MARLRIGEGIVSIAGNSTMTVEVHQLGNEVVSEGYNAGIGEDANTAQHVEDLHPDAVRIRLSSYWSTLRQQIFVGVKPDLE